LNASAILGLVKNFWRKNNKKINMDKSQVKKIVDYWRETAEYDREIYKKLCQKITQKK
jgi:uncharacterized lipoprotein